MKAWLLFLFNVVLIATGQAAASLVDLSSVAYQAPHFYVSPQGNDAGNGSRQRPWKTIQHALRQAHSGTLHILPGVYAERVSFTRSGTADKYFTILADKGAVIDTAALPEPPPAESLSGSFQARNSSYLVIDGIELRNTKNHGIEITGTGRHIHIRNCITRYTRGAGIYVYGKWPFERYYLSHIYVQNNQVHHPQRGRFNNKNVWQEDITIAGGVEHFEVSHNRVNAYDGKNYNGGPIGIDIKDGVRFGKVHHNRVEQIPSNGIYVDAGSSHAHDIDIHSNLILNVSGHGIPVAGEKGGSTYNVNVYNNLLVNIGWNGLGSDDYLRNDSNHPIVSHQPRRTNINFYNNTVVNVGTQRGHSWPSWIATGKFYHGRIYNNIFADLRHTKLRAMKLGPHANSFHNCVFARNPGDSPRNNTIFANPQFLNPAQGDYRLAANSPCAGMGASGNILQTSWSP